MAYTETLSRIANPTIVFAMYDKSKVGKRIGSGFDSVVYRYGEGQVIKFSSLHLLFGKRVHDKLRADYELCKKYFGDFVLDTEDVSNPAGGQHIEVQTYIKGTPLGVKHLRNPKVHEQFKRIVSILRQMQSDGHATIDLSGYGGPFTGTLNNILVDTEHTLHIIDATLFESHSVGGMGLLFAPLFPIVLKEQEKIIQKMLAIVPKK